jgi:hypothetical protein
MAGRRFLVLRYDDRRAGVVLCQMLLEAIKVLVYGP